MEYILTGMCYGFEILHVEGPNWTLFIKIIFFPKWPINVMTSAFLEKIKKWWRHQKFRHYGKYKIWNLKNFIITKSVRSFVPISFLYEEQSIKQFFVIWVCQNDDVTGGQKNVDGKKKFPPKCSQINFRKSHWMPNSKNLHSTHS